jgi:NADPH:quinone reductase-like Zn-dependent oxidoreductase
MKAIVYTEYGPPDVLKMKEVGKPTPKDDEVLIRIHATTVNRSDCGFRKPEPFIVRFFNGLIRPKRPILGTEFAGEIEAMGKDVTSFGIGDPVFGLSGDGFGAHAEYICLPEAGSLATMPANATAEEAAAVCDGAMLALSALKKLPIQQGQEVLINGASGSIGTAAAQLAKYYEADVTAVCSTKNVELVTGLGADEVIDYTEHDFTENGETYDIIFDAVGKSSFARCRSSLKPGGAYIASDLGFLVQNPIYALWTSKFGSKRVIFPIPHHSKADILLFKELVETGKYRAVIDRRYPLEQIVEAYKYVEQGHKRGNVVIIVDRGSKS